MRATRRQAKPGEVLFFFGKLPGDGPDHIGMWGGEGATKRHSNAVMYGFTGSRIEADQTHPLGWRFGNSFLADLEAAGFDTTTIEFRIRIKKPNVQIEPPSRLLAKVGSNAGLGLGRKGESDAN